MNKPYVVIKQGHAKDCWAVKATLTHEWSTPWYLPNEPTYYGDKLGGNRGHTTHWTVFRCNASNCHAWGLIRQIYIEDRIQYEVEKL